MILLRLDYRTTSILFSYSLSAYHKQGIILGFNKDNTKPNK